MIIYMYIIYIIIIILKTRDGKGRFHKRKNTENKIEK
jgi:hypothetical protein